MPDEPVSSLVLQRPVLTDEALDELIARARAAAAAMGIPVSVAIVDSAGLLARFAREAGASLVSIQLAQDKAFTAVSFCVPTHQWNEILKADPQLIYSIPQLPRHTTLGGGFPIRVAGAVVGAIGVSGGHYEQDIQIGRESLKLID